MSAPLQIGLLIFPKVTQLDFTGPLQVFSNVPGAKVHLIWKRIEPVPSDSVLTLTPTTSFADCPQLDVICVPGGAGINDMVNDEEMLDFLRKQAEGAKYVTSVCTGSLVLGAAGLLQGYRAATHWTAMEFLARVRRGAGEDAGVRRPQPDYRRRRHRGHRFCADAGVDHGRPADRRGDPARARIQSGAAVQFGLARHRADRNSGAAARKGLHRTSCAAAKRSNAPRRGSHSPARRKRKRPPGCPDGLSCLMAAPHYRAISGRLHRGPISQPYPDRVPLRIGAVANCGPNRRGGFPPP